MSEANSSSIFYHKNSRLPEDTVFFSIFPDFSLSEDLKSQNTKINHLILSQLQSLHLQTLQTLSSYTTSYIWYGDNLEDEWFVVFLLFETSLKFPNLSICVWDTDGEFLLIEAAFHLPKWLNPETSTNRIFIRGGSLHIIAKSQLPSVPTLSDSLSYVITHEEKTKAASSVQLVIKNRIGDYPNRAVKNMHRVRVRVPVCVAQILKHEPCLISLVVEGFYDRDIDSMKHAANMERFLPNKSSDEIVEVLVKMSRAMYAQLMQQTFQAPKGYSILPRSDGGYTAAELGMKIACGEILSALVRRIDDILSQPFSADEFKDQETPPSDDDSWLYNGDDELNVALSERQQEMEHYNMNHKKNNNSKEQEDAVPSSSSNVGDYDLADIAKSMQEFIARCQALREQKFLETGMLILLLINYLMVS
ncbi:hypothetical protein SSX86_019290 [Deinandra increscens subsp. villosa]|uniref:Uncharacterized protein n=1 Tax=Deinandra increscens subsp. villosa TaxID=3103831 RepID=A0AAP0CX48_9ASTR